eukprot:2801614-Pyramimonas_sp.AAC.2
MESTGTFCRRQSAKTSYFEEEIGFFESRPALPHSAKQAALTHSNGMCFCCSDLWRLEVMQPGSYRWVKLSDSPFGVWGHASVGYGTDILVHGGSTGRYSDTPNDYSARLLRYVSVSNSWTVRGASPGIRVRYLLSCRQFGLARLYSSVACAHAL